MEPKYPDVYVKLVGEDGNAYAILGRVANALRESGISSDEINRFRSDATKGDYSNLLITVMN